MRGHGWRYQLNIILDDQADIAWASKIDPGSRLFKKAFRASLLFWILSALSGLGLFAYFMATKPLTLLRTFDPSEIRELVRQGGDESGRIGLACPCSTSIHTVGSIGSVVRGHNVTGRGGGGGGPTVITGIPIVDYCPAMKLIDVLSSSRTPSIVDMWLILCNAIDDAIAAGKGSLGKAKLNTNIALAPSELRLLLQKTEDEIKANIAQSWATSLRVLESSSSIDGLDAYKNMRRTYSIARRACPDCPVTTPGTAERRSSIEGSKPWYDPSDPDYAPFTQGAPDNACYYSFDDPSHTYASLKEWAWDVIAGQTCGGSQASLVNSSTCYIFSLAIAAAWRDFDGNRTQPRGALTKRCSRFRSFLAMNHDQVRIMTDVWARFGAISRAAGVEQVLSPTAKQAFDRTIFPRVSARPPNNLPNRTRIMDYFTNTMVLNFTVTMDHERYYEACAPKMCTYWTGAAWDRLAECVALTLGLLGAVVRVLRIVLSACVASDKSDQLCCVSSESGAAATTQEEVGLAKDGSYIAQQPPDGRRSTGSCRSDGKSKAADEVQMVGNPMGTGTGVAGP